MHEATATGFEPTHRFSLANGWGSVYEISACGFKSHRSYLNFRCGEEFFDV